MTYQAWSVVFGEQPSAAKWNILGTNDASFNNGTGIANLEIGGVTAVKRDYKFSVYRNASWTSSNSATLVSFDAKLYDTGSNVDIVTNKGRFTAPVAGFYWFSCGIASAAGVQNTPFIAYLYKNGSNTNMPIMGLIETSVSANGIMCGGSVTVQLAANDYIEIYFVGGSGSTMQTGTLGAWFMGELRSNT